MIFSMQFKKAFWLTEDDAMVSCPVLQDGTIQEKAYRQANAAKRFMKNLLMNDDDYVVMTSNAVMDTQSEIP